MICGIDPGLKGGVVILSKKIQSYTVPRIGNKVDWKAYSDIFLNMKDCFVVMEEVHSIYGASAKSNFTFGGIFYSNIALLHAHDISFELIPPKKWQAEIWSNTDKVSNGKKVDSKKTSLLAAKRLFPGQDFLYGDNETPSGRRSKPHDGIVDAFLIAEYARRKFIQK